MNEIISSTLSMMQSDMRNVFGWFDITDQDRARVRALAPLVGDHIDEILDDYYNRGGGFDHPSTTVNELRNLDDIREEQKRHFLELVNSGLDEGYFDSQKEAGIFNENSGVSPAFYLGTYAYFIERISKAVLEGDMPKAETSSTLLSLQRLAACHKALTLEAFSNARQQAIERREREFSELPVPVLKMRKGLLLVPVVGTLDSHRALLLTNRMLEGIKDIGARAVVLDITGVEAVDSAVANHLMQAMAAARLMGAKSVLTGITADVAQALVKIGVTDSALNPAGDLERGIETAERLLEG